MYLTWLAQVAAACHGLSGLVCTPLSARPQRVFDSLAHMLYRLFLIFMNARTHRRPYWIDMTPDRKAAPPDDFIGFAKMTADIFTLANISGDTDRSPINHLNLHLHSFLV
jgi:hypothetical protein